MVAIKNVALFSALAACVAAAPVAAPAASDVTVSGEYTVSDVENLFKASLDIQKRDLGSVVSVVLGVIGDLVVFLGQTLSSVLTLDLSSESDALTNLLAGLNAQVLKLVSSLGNLGPLSGLGGLLQKVLINTGLTTVLLSLSTTVSTLVAKILKNGGVLSDVEKTAFTTLQTTLTTLLSTLQGLGLGDSVISTIQGILGQITQVL